MKQMLCFILMCLLFTVCAEAEAYIVMSDDERILTSLNEHEQRSIASITKIMTAIVCIENGNEIDVWTVGDEIIQADEKRIYLTEGQVVSKRSLLYGLMLESGNDAAIVLAKRVGGTVEKFVGMMNEKAQELGMHNTLFTNPHGLDVHEQGNLSTCFDMALLMKYALKNDTFCEIIGTQTYQAEWGSIFHNSNRLLKDFPFTIGGKTGYTRKAGRTLVTAARNQNLTLICVTMNLQDHFQFHQDQYVQSFNTMKSHVLMKEGTYRWFDRIFEIEEPFTVTCTEQELSLAEIRSSYDNLTGELIFQFVLDDYVVTKSVKTKKEKTWCFLRWCL